MNTIEVLTLLLVIFAPLPHIDEKSSCKQGICPLWPTSEL